MSSIPKDPYILYSYINMMLRDRYASLQEFCDANDTAPEVIKDALASIGFEYNEDLNQFR